MIKQGWAYRQSLMVLSIKRRRENIEKCGTWNIGGYVATLINMYLTKQKLIPQIISFFSSLLSHRLQQYQMSFSNYEQPFFQAPYYYTIPFYSYQSLGYPFSEAPLDLVNQQCTIFPQKSDQQKDCKQPDLKIVEEKLKKLHFQSQHHRKTHWTAQQDKLLQRLVEIQKLDWKQIPKHFQNRTQNMCYSRYRRISLCSKDRNWRQEDEELVVALVSHLGQKWKMISSRVTKFTPKQIRQRYLNYLRPDILKEDFSLEEDLKICEFVIQHGKHWRKMQLILPGRPQGSIKGRYYGKLQKILHESINQVAKNGKLRL